MLDRLFNCDIPLVRKIRLYGHMTAIAVSDFVRVFANFFEKFFLPEPFYNSLTRLETIHIEQILCFRLTGILPAVLIANRAIGRHNIDYLKSVSLADFPVVRVVGRCDFQKACGKPRLFIVTVGIRQHNVLISNNRDNPTHNWKANFFTNKIFGTFVRRIHRNSSVAKHCLRAGSCDSNVFNLPASGVNRLDKRISQIPEMPLHQLVLDFIVGQYRLGGGVPVDQSFSPINQPVFKEFEKCSANGFCTYFIHCKACSLPVTGAAHRFQLADNAGLIFILPGLNTSNKLLTLEVGSPLSLFREDSLFDNCLCSDTGVVGTGHPEGVVILHSAETNQDVLQCIIQCVAKMQRRGNIRRRDYNCIGLPVFVVTRQIRMKIQIRRP